MTGMSGVFFLSTLHGRSVRALFIFLGIAGIIFLGWFILTGSNPALLFPPVILFTASWDILLAGIVLFLVPFISALLLFSPDVQTGTKTFKNRMKSLTRRLSFLPGPALAAKDIIDLWRSGSILGQTIFSFFVPLVIIWFFLSLLDGYLLKIHLLLTFAIITGIVASTMYTWLCMFDSFSIYALFPISVRDVIISKIISFSTLSRFLLSLSQGSQSSPESGYLLPVIALTISVSYYVLSVSIWLTGLSPAVLVYNVRVMIMYFLLIGLALSVFGSLTVISPGIALQGFYY